MWLIAKMLMLQFSVLQFSMSQLKMISLIKIVKSMLLLWEYFTECSRNHKLLDLFAAGILKK